MDASRILFSTMQFIDNQYFIIVPLELDIRILPLQKKYNIYIINCRYCKVYRLE